MSAMKAFEADVDELTLVAFKVALMDGDDERARALNVVFAECGRKAEAYPDPLEAAKAFVVEVTSVYVRARNFLRLEDPHV
ncbi:hypothetical protein [Streptomyces sp. NPDC001422]|uniref:hypothetical protein n=1 Tax=Streptomyces sp. NPDC001422 TaxID=3364575 RepID=UPI0036A1E835